MRYLTEKNRTRVRDKMLQFGCASDAICTLLRHPKVLSVVENALRKRGFDEATAAQLARKASDALCEPKGQHWYSLFISGESCPESWFASTLATLEPAAAEVEIELPAKVRAEFDQLLLEVEMTCEAIPWLLHNPQANAPEEKFADAEFESDDDDMPSDADWNDEEKPAKYATRSEPDTLRKLRSIIRNKGVKQYDDVNDLIAELIQETIKDLYRVWHEYRQSADLERWMSGKIQRFLVPEFHRQNGRQSSTQREADFPEPAADDESDDVPSPIERVGVAPEYPNPIKYVEDVLSNDLQTQIIFLQAEGRDARPRLSCDHIASLLCISDELARKYASEAWKKLTDAAARLPQRHAQFQPPEGKLPFSYKYDALDLTIELYELSPHSVRVVLSGGERWRGKLVQLFWQWYDTAHPDQEIIESLYAWALFPETPLRGRYRAEIILRERLTFAPYIAYILPQYAVPEIFEQQWKCAAAKPSIEALEKWVKRNQQALMQEKRGQKKAGETSRAEQWEKLLHKLRNGSGESHEYPTATAQ